MGCVSTSMEVVSDISGMYFLVGFWMSDMNGVERPDNTSRTPQDNIA